jgi:ribosomal-protein-alanine N-acetyltransferase
VCVEPHPERAAEIRACRSADLAEVHRILRAAPESATWSAEGLASFFELYPGHNLVACSRHEIVGFISGRRVADEGEILNLAVKGIHRRRGMGRALVSALLEALEREGVGRVFLEVRESNAEGIAFYRALGFSQIGRREGYYREAIEAALVLARDTRFLAPKK